MIPPWKKPATRRKKRSRSIKNHWMPQWRNIKKWHWKTLPVPGKLSAEQLNIRRDWTARQSRLKEKLFSEVREQILKFMESSRYEEYLCSKIEEAVCFAEHDEIQIYLSREDEPRLKSLTIKTGFPLKLSGNSFIGGIKAVIPEKNILIDNSFEEGYNAAYRDFKFNGGPAHE